MKSTDFHRNPQEPQDFCRNWPLSFDIWFLLFGAFIKLNSPQKIVGAVLWQNGFFGDFLHRLPQIFPIISATRILQEIPYQHAPRFVQKMLFTFTQTGRAKVLETNKFVIIAKTFCVGSDSWRADHHPLRGSKQASLADGPMGAVLCSFLSR